MNYLSLKWKVSNCRGELTLATTVRPFTVVCWNVSNIFGCRFVGLTMLASYFLLQSFTNGTRLTYPVKIRTILNLANLFTCLPHVLVSCIAVRTKQMVYRLVFMFSYFILLLLLLSNYFIDYFLEIRYQVRSLL